MIHKSVSYVLVFSFLLTVSGCYTTQQYSDTPEKIFSGKSDIDLSDDFTLDSISLKSKQTLKVRNYVAQYIENQKEKYLVYYYPKGTYIDSLLMLETNSKIPLYKTPIADTLNFNAIDSIHFTRKKADMSYAILGGVFAIPVVLFLLGYLFLRIDSQH